MNIVCYLSVIALASQSVISNQNWPEMRGGVVSQDGAFIFSDGGTVACLDLRTGKLLSEGWFRAAILKGRPLIPVARTMNQAHYDKGSAFPSESLLTNRWRTGETWRFVDAENKDRLLAVTEPSSIGDGSKYFILTELELDRRVGNPNKSWVLDAPIETRSQAVRARFVDGKKVEIWVLQRLTDQTVLKQYFGDRQNPIRGLKSVKEIRLGKSRWPEGRIVFNSLDLNKGSFIWELGTSLFTKYSFAGEVLGEADFSKAPYSIDMLTSAVWSLTVPERSVTGGKDKWTPIARSADMRVWQVKDKETGQFKLFKL